MLHPFLVNTLFYPSIASNLVTLATLSPSYDSAYIHLLSLLEVAPLEVTQYGRKRATNKLLASFK